MRHTNRRRDPRYGLQCHQIPTCNLQDPAGKTSGIIGRILDLSRGGAAIYLEPGAADALALEQEFLVTAALPHTGMRLKRVARVISQRQDERCGKIVGLRWTAADAADRYAQMQEARFAEALDELMQKGGRGRSSDGGDFVALVAKQARRGPL